MCNTKTLTILALLLECAPLHAMLLSTRLDKAQFSGIVTNSGGVVSLHTNAALQTAFVIMPRSNLMFLLSVPMDWSLSVRAGTNRLVGMSLGVQDLSEGKGQTGKSAPRVFDIQHRYGMISFTLHERLLVDSELIRSAFVPGSGTVQTMPVREIAATGPAPAVATIPDPFASATNVWDRGRFRIWLKAQRGKAGMARDNGMHMAQMVVARPARAAEAWRVRLTVREGTDVLFRAEMAWEPLSTEASRHRARLDPSHDPALEYDRLNFSVAESLVGTTELEFVRADAAENPAEWKAFRLPFRECMNNQ
jgi:hypothetical protein